METKYFEMSIFVKSVNVYSRVRSLAVAVRGDHSEMWAKLGDSSPLDGEKPGLHFRLFPGKVPREGGKYFYS